MSKIILTFIILISTNPLLAQDYSCGTPPIDSAIFVNQPHYGNNQYLIDLIDSLDLNTSSSNKVFEEDVIFRIPIKIWNYRDDDGNGGVDMLDLRDWIQELNQIQIDNVTGFRFYLLCEISNIDDDDHLNVTDTEAFGLSNNTFGLHQKGAINVHLVEELNNGGRGTYYVLTDGIFVEFSALNTTLTHEIGHFFGLDHVFRKWDASVLATCKSEPVDRDSEFSTFSVCVPIWASHVKCESTGDALCDTPANLRLTGTNTNFQNCVYFGNEVDIEGVNYNNPPAGSAPPNPLNIMANAPVGTTCRNFYSPMQRGVMLSNAIGHLGIGGPAPDLANMDGVLYPHDENEPNDRMIWATEVIFDTPLRNTFHQSYLGTYLLETTTENCDEDWFEFNSLDNYPISIKVKEVSGYSRPELNVSLFDSDLNFI